MISLILILDYRSLKNKKQSPSPCYRRPRNRTIKETIRTDKAREESNDAASLNRNRTSG